MLRQFRGTEKQLKWCQEIYQQLSQLYGSENLPDVAYAGWWIEHRADNLAELQRASHFKEVALTQLQHIYNKHTEIIVCDTETTGLGKGHEIIELALVDLQGKPLFHSLLRPVKVSIHPRAYAVHGISMSDVAHRPTIGEIWSVIEPFVTNRTILAYNSSFDITMLQQSLKASQIKIPLLRHSCMMNLLKNYLELDTPIKLVEACYRFNIDTTRQKSHGALEDALATSTLVQKLFLQENMLTQVETLAS